MNDISGTDDNVASTYASAIPLSSVTITDIFLGDETCKPYGSKEWTPVEITPSAVAPEYVSCSIDATGYSYIRIRVLQWGQSTWGSKLLDGERWIHGEEYRCYNRLGQVASAGDIVYGFHDDYIFKIPNNTRQSKAVFSEHFDQSGYNISKQATATITWTTPTDPAPTTPEILYNVRNDNDYAVVTGLSTSMEYCGEFTDGAGKTYLSSWNSVTGEALLVPINDEPYNFLVRYKASGNNNPSLSCRIPVKARAAAPNNEYIAYYEIDEILAIYPCEKQIEVALGDGTSYIPVSAAYYDVASFIDKIPADGFNRIYVRYAATSDEPASKSGIIQIYGRNPNTPDDVYYENGVLYNLTPEMVFRFNGGDWYSTNYSSVNITSFMSSTDTTLLEIKYMPTETASCSAARQLTLPALS